MSFYADEFLSAKPGEFEKKEFNIGADQSLETEVFESLNAFGIRGKVIGSESGPYITRVYFKLDRGVRFNSIEPLTDDLKMSLGTSSIKIMPDPERGAVAIEIPNIKREDIPFGNVFHANHSDMALPAALGVDSKGNPIYLDISNTPHLLIAGTTGSGKSVCLNSIITSLALNCRPTDLQFLLIDPKGNEFVHYESIKNLISGKIIDDVETALKSLAWLVEEMERRYKIFKNCKCRLINEYKHKRNFGLNDGVSTCFVEDLPYIVVVIDEYADLMMNSTNALQEDVKKLGQKARAAGIHLILATQRPSTKIIDGDIKTNFPTRIALKVSSIADSKTILDHGGAERLLGKGDMLLKRQGEEDPQRVHGCFISNDEIKKAIELLPQKKLYQINEADVFERDIHDLHAQEDLKKHATWGELNAVSKVVLEYFGEFMDGKCDTIYQVCASQFGVGKSRVDVAFSDVSNAIGDSDFYQVLQRSCSEKDENCDYPFVKAVIYSSPLRWKFKDGRYLFTDYILEQAFEKDDAAAMASLEKLKNKVVNELENEYCDDIEEYPNKGLFDRLLAEAYPPLMNFLLESGNEQYIIDAAESNSRIEDFVVEQALIDESWENFVFENPNDFREKCVQRMAEMGDEKAIECICDWDDDYISDSVRETIFQLAVQDKDKAIKKVACYSREYELDKRLWELTERGQNKAIEYICQHIEHGDYGSCDTDLVFDFAKSGNERACKCIRGNYDAFEDYVIEFIDGQDFADVKDFAEKINLFQHVDCRVKTYAHFVCDMANEGDVDAWSLIYDNASNYFIQQYIIEKAEEADEKAWDCIRGHNNEDEYHDYVKSCLWHGGDKIEKLARDIAYNYWYDYRDDILELACNDDESAKEAVYATLDSDEERFCEFVLNDAQNGNGKSQKEVYKNPQLFQQYILDEAQLGDDDAIDVIYSHPEVNAFYNLILQHAKAGGDDAMECVYKHPEKKDFQDIILEQISLGNEEATKFVFANTKYELFQRCIVELALHGDCDAKKVVLANLEIGPFQEYIYKQATSSDKDAKSVVLANVKYDLFKKCLAELALHGDCDAKKAVLANPEIAPFQECICQLALQNDSDAKKIIQNNYVDLESFQKCMVDCALQGDEYFASIIYERIEQQQKKTNKTHPNPETIDNPIVLAEIDDIAQKYYLTPFEEQQLISEIKKDVKKYNFSYNWLDFRSREAFQTWASNIIRNRYSSNIIDKIFRGFIVSRARQNEGRALKCIEFDPQNKEYEIFLIEQCSERNEWALTIVCDNSDYYRYWINEVIKNRYDKNNLRDLLIEKILRQAKDDEKALKYVVCRNPQEEKFKDLIVETFQKNEDVVECIYRYYLREIPSYHRSDFCEFIKQRISKEFGFHFKNDDELLKRKIEDLKSDGSKYFVLAKAWGGDKSALNAVRGAFLGFSRIIIECLEHYDSQIRAYAMECVNSDTIGNAIKEMAIVGNDAAKKILLIAKRTSSKR